MLQPGIKLPASCWLNSTIFPLHHRGFQSYPTNTSRCHWCGCVWQSTQLHHQQCHYCQYITSATTTVNAAASSSLPPTPGTTRKWAQTTLSLFGPLVCFFFIVLSCLFLTDLFFSFWQVFSFFLAMPLPPSHEDDWHCHHHSTTASNCSQGGNEWLQNGVTRPAKNGTRHHGDRTTMGWDNHRTRGKANEKKAQETSNDVSWAVGMLFFYTSHFIDFY